MAIGKENTYSPNLKVGYQFIGWVNTHLSSDPPKLEQELSAIIKLRELPQLANFNHVTVQAKIHVVTTFDPTTEKDIIKQENTIQ